MQKDIADMDPKNLSDVPAFQDEFTREFMAATDEVSDGHYLFESKTDGYTILFSEDAHIDQIHYEKVKDHYEGIKFGSDSERITGESYTVFVTYENPTIPDEPDIQVSLVRKSVNYDGEFDKREHGDVTHYFAQKKYVLSDQTSSVYRFFGAVESNDTNQYISYIYSVDCPDEQKGCDYDLEAIEKKVEKVMPSVEYNDNEGGNKH